MELRDFIVTPIVLVLVYFVAYWLRPRFTDINTRRYFIPALTVRIIGAISVGFLYQFYYDGGDTFTYHTRGSAVIWQAFMDSPINGVRLLFAGTEQIPELFRYTKEMWFFGDLASYFVIRVAAVFDLLTFRTYSATAVLFAVLSFSGGWALYQVFYKRFTFIHLQLAIAALFVPSVFFWGSGIFKDTITLAALGWATYCFDRAVFQRKQLIVNTIFFLISVFVIFSIKMYILLCFMPALIIWVYSANIFPVRSIVFKAIFAPIVFVAFMGLGYWAVVIVSEDDPRYAVENLAKTAQITAYDIRYGWGARDGIGSGYELGKLDGTFGSMLRLMPEAINVSLFRPYLWEVRNPLMLLSAVESFFVLLLASIVLYKTRIVSIYKKGTMPIVLFCLAFSLVFAFAVGVSTYNFGTLMRYKIPLMPFFLCALLVILHLNSKKQSS